MDGPSLCGLSVEVPTTNRRSALKVRFSRFAERVPYPAGFPGKHRKLQ
jgi:hypothetical protein